MTTYAIRHPDRGKAREVHKQDRRFMLAVVPACGASGVGMEFLRVPLADVPPEERCKRCWPEGGGVR